MTLSIFSAKNFSSKLKVTIQATGKLGFTAETAKALALSSNTYIKIAGDEEQKNLYMIICNAPNEDGFKVNCISNYYSLPTTILFNYLGVDYTNYTVIYDLSREQTLDKEADGKVYKMKQRQIPKNKKEVAMK